MDGSTVKMPRQKEIIEYFGKLFPGKGAPCPMARVLQLFDVNKKFTLDAIIAPFSIGEREPASLHAFQRRPTGLLLLDRGYASFQLLKIMLHTGVNYRARVKRNQWTAVQSFFEFSQLDTMVIISPNTEAKKQRRELWLDVTPINIKLIRIESSGGEVEILATSLTDTNIFKYDQFKELYHYRRPIEDDYKVMKHRIEVENWSGETVESVFHDFHAKVLVENITAALAHCTRTAIKRKTNYRKYEYRINFN
ncbi:MAG: transposase [Pseudomonadota bacterium]